MYYKYYKPIKLLPSDSFFDWVSSKGSAGSARDPALDGDLVPAGPSVFSSESSSLSFPSASAFSNQLHASYC